MASDSLIAPHDHQGDHGSRPARGPFATAVLVLVGFALILGVVVGFGWLITHAWQRPVESFDDDVARWFVDQRTPSLTDAADLGTYFGETIVSLVLTPLVALGVWVWQRSVVPALFIVLVTSGVGGFYFVGTHLDPRQRPPVKILDPGLVPTHSFPSGHVGTAAALYGAIVVLAWVYAGAARRWVTPLLLLPVIVLVSRLYLGAHHLTDVLTSLVYAAVWIALLATLLLRRERQ